MSEFIPEFISRRYKEGRYKGDFDAAAMFVDVAGFTVTTEKLMRHGKVGAEVLSDMLNKVFEPVIDAVYEKGGFVVGFAGDAFTAVFPSGAWYGVSSAREIQDAMEREGTQETEFGRFDLSVRVGLSYGRVNWGIVGTDDRKTYFFKGAPIENCARAAAACGEGELAIDETVFTVEDRAYAETEGRGSGPRGETSKPTGKAPETVASAFLPGILLARGQPAEFRDVVPVFVSFEDIGDFRELDDFVATALATADRLGGYFNVLDFGDKGPTILVVFGAPVSYEDNATRAADFVLGLKGSGGRPVRGGITFGTAYAGTVGSRRRSTYTVLGDTVNLASRFMERAESGEVWVSAAFADKIKGLYEIAEKGAFIFKGKAEPEEAFELTSSAKRPKESFFEGTMIGRDAELAQVRSFCKPLSEGKFCGVLYVHGEAGIGKSRLVFELTENMKPGVRTFILQPDHVLYKSMNPFTNALKNYFGQSDENTYGENEANFEAKWSALIEKLEHHDDIIRAAPTARELTRVKPIVGSLFNLYWEGSLFEELDAKGRHENTIFAIKEFFKAESFVQPIILLTEDIHHLDDDSKAVLETLTRRIEDFPVAVFALGRYLDDGSKPFLSLGETVPTEELVLEQLPSRLLADLVEERLGLAPDDELLAFIESKTEGNPFYVEQFCLYLSENDLVEIRDGRYSLTAKEIDVPGGIRAVIVARLDRLSRELKKLVQTAAVLGREIDVLVLAGMLKGVDVEPSLLEGEVERIWLAVSEVLYIFRHALLRDTAYDMQLRSRLRELHTTAAETVESIYGRDKPHYADIAFHYEKGDVAVKAKEYLSLAADYAKENYKNEEALDLYERLSNYTENAKEVIDVQGNIAGILQLTGDWKRAEELCRRNVELAEGLGEERLTAETEFSLGGLLRIKGDFGEAQPLLEGALGTFSDLGDLSGVARASGEVGIISAMQGDYGKAMDSWRTQLDAANAIGDKTHVHKAYIYIGNVYSRQGDDDKSLEFYKKAMGIAEELGNKRMIRDAAMSLGVAAAGSGKHEEASSYFETNLKLSEELGDKQNVCQTLSNVANLELMRGYYEAAIRSFERALGIADELGDDPSTSVIYLGIAGTYKAVNEYDQALQYYEKAIEGLTKYGLKHYLCAALNENADMKYEMGDISSAEKLNEEALKLADEIKRPDTSFNCKILRAKIKSHSDKESATEELKTLLNEEIDEMDLADVYYELYKITRDSDYKAKAVSSYRRLYETTSVPKFKSRAEELEGASNNGTR